MYTSTDPLYDNARERSIEFIRSQIINMIENGNEGDMVDAIVQDISLNDIDRYMRVLENDGSLPFKLPLIRSSTVNDPEIFSRLCDYTGVYNVNIPPVGLQRVYFLETADFAITFIPIQLDGNEINVHIEPLECSPDFILEMWEKESRQKGLDDIEWVKFD